MTLIAYIFLVEIKYNIMENGNCAVPKNIYTRYNKSKV